jgi:hypothetical protein
LLIPGLSRLGGAIQPLCASDCQVGDHGELGARQGDQRIEGGLCGAGLVAADLVDVEIGGIGEALLGVAFVL